MLLWIRCGNFPVFVLPAVPQLDFFCQWYNFRTPTRFSVNYDGLLSDCLVPKRQSQSASDFFRAQKHLAMNLSRFEASKWELKIDLIFAWSTAVSAVKWRKSIADRFDNLGPRKFILQVFKVPCLCCLSKLQTCSVASKCFVFFLCFWRGSHETLSLLNGREFLSRVLWTANLLNVTIWEDDEVPSVWEVTQ